MNKIIVVIIVLILVGFAGYRFLGTRGAEENSTGNPPNSAENAPEGSLHNLPVPEGVSKAKTALAAKLSINESEILVLEAIEKEWPDACLGLALAGEMCAQMITPGYQVKLQAKGKEYSYRVNSTGTVVRAE